MTDLCSRVSRPGRALTSPARAYGVTSVKGTRETTDGRGSAETLLWDPACRRGPMMKTVQEFGGEGTARKLIDVGRLTFDSDLIADRQRAQGGNRQRSGSPRDQPPMAAV